MGKHVAEDPAGEPAREGRSDFAVGIPPAALVISGRDALGRAAGVVSGREVLIQAAMAEMPDVGDFIRVGGLDADFIQQVAGATGVYDAIADVTKGLAQLEGMRGLHEAITASAANALASAAFHDLRLSDNIARVMADMNFGLSDNMTRALADVDFGLSDNMTRVLADTNFGLLDNLAREPLFGLSGPLFGHLAGGTEIVVPAANPVAQRLVERFRERVPRSDRLLIGDRYYRPAYPLSHADETADAPPDDAVLLHVLRVARGTLTQLGNLFEHFFGPARSPDRCFVVRGREVGRWTIYQAEDTGRDARERASYANGVVGFIVGVDLPVAMLEFYRVTESEEPRISAFVERLQKGMEASGFRLDIAGQKSTRETHAGVSDRLREVRRIREERKHKGVVRITRQAACDLAGIDSRTVKKHEPELYERWEDSEF